MTATLPTLKALLDHHAQFVNLYASPRRIVVGGTWPAADKNAGGQLIALRKGFLGLADDDQYVEIAIEGGFFGKRWADCSAYGEGRITAVGPAVEVWRVHLFRDGTPGSLEVFDRPAYREVYHGPVGRAATAVDLERLRKGLALIGRVARGGRPRGSGLTLDQIRNGIALARRDHTRPTPTSVSTRLAPYYSDSTIRKVVRAAGLVWSDLLDE